MQDGFETVRPIPTNGFLCGSVRSRAPSSKKDISLLQQGECFWEHVGDWIPAESSPSKIAIFKLKHFSDHTLKLIPFLASSL